MKKYIFSFILCISMLLVFGFTFSASAATTEDYYNESSEETFDYILNNIDIDIKYLEPEVLGIYFAGATEEHKDTALLYLIWVSPYFTRKGNTILQFVESGKVYNLYNTKEMDMSNWMATISKSYPSDNLSINITAIGGIVETNKKFGIELKDKYSITNLKYGYEGTLQPLGQIENKVKFDLGMTPKLNSKSLLQMKTHAYEIVKDIEIQSVYEPLKSAGYSHYVYMNFNINVEKIYRIDTDYYISNQDRTIWDIFRPTDEKHIVKSLYPERISTGVFGLYDVESFEEGQFSSVKDSSKTYKYKIFLNHKDQKWNFLKGSEFYEADYKNITDFRIIRMNYLVDDEVYDVYIKMDSVNGSTLMFYDNDVISSNDDVRHKIDDLIDNIKTSFNNFKNNFDKYKTAFIIIGCCLGGIVLMIPLLKFIFYMKSLLGNKGKDQTG